MAKSFRDGDCSGGMRSTRPTSPPMRSGITSPCRHSLPALLLRPDIQWRAVDELTLDARFPASLPTHSPTQQFHFDPHTWLLRQHDYTAEIFGPWAKAAHLVLEHGRWDGIPFPAQRIVFPRRRDGRAHRAPVLIWIEVHEWRLV